MYRLLSFPMASSKCFRSFSLMALVLKLVWHPVPSRSQEWALGSKVAVIPKSSYTWCKMKLSTQRCCPRSIPSQGLIWNSHEQPRSWHSILKILTPGGEPVPRHNLCSLTTVVWILGPQEAVGRPTQRVLPCAHKNIFLLCSKRECWLLTISVFCLQGCLPWVSAAFWLCLKTSQNPSW